MTAPTSPARFLTAGDTALVVELGDAVDRSISDRVLALGDTITAASIDGIVELVPTFRSLMIHYDPLRIGHDALEAAVHPLLAGLDAIPGHGRLWRLPCCYGGELGPDEAVVRVDADRDLPERRPPVGGRVGRDRLGGVNARDPHVRDTP